MMRISVAILQIPINIFCPLFTYPNRAGIRVFCSPWLINIDCLKFGFQIVQNLEYDHQMKLRRCLQCG